MMIQKSKNWRATFWMLFPVALLVTSVSGWLWMVSMAVDDPGFALEPDYYKKASAYDEVMAQKERNSQLGYKAHLVSFSLLDKDAAELIIHVKDREGRGVAGAEVTAEGLFVGRAFHTQKVVLKDRGDGVYAASFNQPRAGLWEVRLSLVAVQGALFTQTLRPELTFERRGALEKGGPSPS
jgi:nitrogen fixation protein FixH